MTQRHYVLSSDFKSVFTSGADYVVLAFCLGKSENCLAFGAFAVNVGLSVSPFVFDELEKSAEFFIFPSALVDVF